MNPCCCNPPCKNQCAQCAPSCSAPSAPSNACAVPTKLEPRNVDTCVCSPKACSIFGVHDLNYDPPAGCKFSRPRRKDLSNVNTLGNPIGVLHTSLALALDREVSPDEVQNLRFAMYLKAFARTYLVKERDWRLPILDETLREGLMLFEESNNMYLEEEEEEGEAENADEVQAIYSNAEKRIKRDFLTGNCHFKVVLMDKVDANGLDEIPMSRLELTLREFFRDATHGLLQFGDWYALVYKVHGVYFVFDFNGRNLEDFVVNHGNGQAMMICFKSIDNVVHLFGNLSGLNENDTFTLREVRVSKLTDPHGKTVSRDFDKRNNEWIIISDEYGFIKASLHLTLNRADALRNRSALPVAVAALLTSKLDHPATWTRKVIDKIMCYGVNVCRYGWNECLKLKEPINLSTFPPQLKLGQFYMTFQLTPHVWDGVWKCVPNYQQGELTTALEKSFELGHGNLMVQINQQMYAVWKKNNFIYFLDPYRHRIVGHITIGTLDSKSATLRMFRSMDTFLSVFNQVLMESNKTSVFYIHSLRVRKIELAEKAEGVPAVEAPIDDSDIISLNEAVCFEDDELRCQEELGEISDYDDEEPIIIIDEEKSESETDEDIEEEEGGMEDLGEFESSSGDDGDGTGRRKKKRGGGKKGGAGDGGDGKGKRGKSKDKGGKKKKKGGANDDDGKKKGKKDKDKKNKKKGKKGGDDDDAEKSKKKKDNKGKGKKGKGDGDTSDDEKSKKDKKNKKGKKGKGDESDSDEMNKEKKAKKKGKGNGSDDSSRKDKEDSSSTGSKKDVSDKNKKTDEFSSRDDANGDRDTGRFGDQTGHGGAGLGSAGFGGIGTGYGAGHTDGTGFDADGPSAGGGLCSEFEKDGSPRKVSYKPNQYPGYSFVPYNMAVVGSESGTYESICKLLRAGFKCADRILTMTPWGNYVVFRGDGHNNIKLYFLFDGCTCNVNRFRHLDLRCGTAGLICFETLYGAISYIIDSKTDNIAAETKSRKNLTVGNICKQVLTPPKPKDTAKDIFDAICNEIC